MTKTYQWTTPRGAKIVATITAEHITRETISADGWDVDVACSRYHYQVDSLTVNGKGTDSKELWTERGVRCILIGHSGKERLLVELTNDVIEDVYCP